MLNDFLRSFWDKVCLFFYPVTFIVTSRYKCSVKLTCIVAIVFSISLSNFWGCKYAGS